MATSMIAFAGWAVPSEASATDGAETVVEWNAPVRCQGGPLDTPFGGVDDWPGQYTAAKLEFNEGYVPLHYDAPKDRTWVVHWDQNGITVLHCRIPWTAICIPEWCAEGEFVAHTVSSSSGRVANLYVVDDTLDFLLT